MKKEYIIWDEENISTAEWAIACSEEQAVRIYLKSQDEDLTYRLKVATIAATFEVSPAQKLPQTITKINP